MAAELPHITYENAATYPPPSLNSYRTAASRGPTSKPAIWFLQMTGSTWDCQARSFDVAKKRWRRMADDDYFEKEKARLAERDEAREVKVKEQRRSDDILNMRDSLFVDLLGRAGLEPKVRRANARDIASRSYRYSHLTVWERHEQERDDKQRLEDWRLAMLESADHLGLLYREGEPPDEFVYHLSNDCREYCEFAAHLHAQNAPFCLPTEGPAAQICRLGEEGYDWCREPAEGQEIGCFPVASAELLEKACYAWLYDCRPHVMAVLDQNLLMLDGVSHLLWREDEDLPDGSSMWRWRVEQRPAREDVYRSGVLTPTERGIPRHMIRGAFMPNEILYAWYPRKKRAREVSDRSALHPFGPKPCTDNSTDQPSRDLRLVSESVRCE